VKFIPSISVLSWHSSLRIEPIADTCRELPYEQLNTLINHMAEYGKYRYVKAVREDDLDTRVISQEFSRFLSLPERPGVNLTLIREYIPTQKILSVARDATAFSQRDTKNHVVVLSTWEDNYEENFKFVKEASNDLLSLTVQSGASKEKNNYFGYGNYCISSDLFTFAATHSTISRWR
jgi:hypothetical protein